jgi:hypothetical protein
MAEIGGTGPVTATPTGAPNNQPPSPPRTGFFGFSRQRWKEILLRDVVIAALLGLVFFGVSHWFEQQRASQAERLENLRFVRDVATRESGPMPFRNLNLEAMKLNGLRLPCRDDPTASQESCFYKADFTDANLSGADMRLMDLTGADFTDADLSGADLRESDLSGAIMTGAEMDDVQLQGACENGTTAWPEGKSLLPQGNTEIGDVCNPGL